MSPRPPITHGTRACYLRGCRLQACCDAHNRYCKNYRATSYSSGRRRVDSAAALKHCQLLASLGWSNCQIAAAAGCSDSTIHRLVRGCSPTISRDVERRILKAAPEVCQVVRRGYADPVGTMRRGRALIAMGHTLRYIADEVGVEPDRLGQILNGQRTTIRANTARRMSEVYARLVQVPGTSRRSQLLAQDRDWHGPMAWGADIDDPAAQPECGLAEPPLAYRAQVKDRAAEALHLYRLKVTPPEIAARTGLSVERVREQITEARGRLRQSAA